MARQSVKKITLALQGGGSHGAYTWGVLDRLLEEEALEIEAVSGTSAGALNAAVLGSALVHGRLAARSALTEFWRAVSDAGELASNPFRHRPSTMFPGWNIDQSPFCLWLNMVGAFFSPYDNPFYLPPLESILDRAIHDYRVFQDPKAPAVYVCATNVQTNRRRVFSGKRNQLSKKALLASTCIPTFCRAVDLDGNVYWDGGYTGNPALTPLLSYCGDIAIVAVNPFRCTEIPERAWQINDRMNEITFNASLLQEVNTIHSLNKLIRKGTLKDPDKRLIHFHYIRAEEEMQKLGLASKYNTAFEFLTYLKNVGRDAADEWLKRGWGKIGVESSVDVERELVANLHENWADE